MKVGTYNYKYSKESSVTKLDQVHKFSPWPIHSTGLDYTDQNNRPIIKGL